MILNNIHGHRVSFNFVPADNKVVAYFDEGDYSSVEDEVLDHIGGLYGITLSNTRLFDASSRHQLWEMKGVAQVQESRSAAAEAALNDLKVQFRKEWNKCLEICLGLLASTTAKLEGDFTRSTSELREMEEKLS